jgi:alkanesulfonate monooxygenase SsuD/methylene tetrahydromethanopterin reductase-like flavin-dependent oxidoreductase (luciferase family)
MHGVGDVMAKANRWDPAPVAAMRAEGQKVAARLPGTEGPTKRAALIGPARVLPGEWLSETSAIGTVEQCAKTLHDYLDAGADEVVLHGTTAEHLESTVRAFAAR